jgi:hypothetical protein
MQKIFQSRPVSIPPEGAAPELSGCPYWNLKEIADPEDSGNHCFASFTKIRQDEREKVLIEILAFVDTGEISLPDEENEESNDYVFSGELRAKIQSLRQQKERDQECPRT